MLDSDDVYGIIVVSFIGAMLTLALAGFGAIVATDQQVDELETENQELRQELNQLQEQQDESVAVDDIEGIMYIYCSSGSYPADSFGIKGTNLYYDEDTQYLVNDYSHMDPPQSHNNGMDKIEQKYYDEHCGDDARDDA